MLLTFRMTSHQTARSVFSHLGYHPEIGSRGQAAYARRLGRLPFPRFHLYVHEASVDQLSFRLHLDQKKPSYAQGHAHAADYEGAAVAAEAARIAQMLGRA